MQDTGALIRGAIVLAAGLFCLWASITDRPWYWRATRRRGLALEKRIGPKSFRYFYLTINAAVTILGLYMTVMAFAATGN